MHASPLLLIYFMTSLDGVIISVGIIISHYTLNHHVVPVALK